MRRYVTGMVTGSLVGAVVAGVWLLRGPRRTRTVRAVRQAGRLAPTAYRFARYGGKRLVHVAKRRLS